MLSARGIKNSDVKSIISHPRIKDYCKELATNAHKNFRDAELALSRCHRNQMIPAIMMMQNYSRILDKLIKRGWSRLGEPVSLSRAQKLWLIMRYALL